ncbi:unnamed protein product [Anisakis simplex]|uniref:NET domain-containing protein n=1 Tax=Anisakis simplex TaxID=6269 RepID=A0A0M3K0B4_ANISI|nr:unnamed protein product [Anisakis simplex]
MSNDYSEDEEARYDRRLRRLTDRALQIHRYFVRKQLIVNDEGIQLRPESPKLLVVQGTGSQFLDELITDHINKCPDGTKGFRKHMGDRCYMDVDDLGKMIDQLENEGKYTGCPKDEEGREKFILNTITNVSHQIKAFWQDVIRENIDEDEQFCKTSAEANEAAGVVGNSEGEVEAGPSPPQKFSWQQTSVQLQEAVTSGSLLVNESATDDGKNIETISIHSSNGNDSDEESVVSVEDNDEEENNDSFACTKIEEEEEALDASDRTETLSDGDEIVESVKEVVDLVCSDDDGSLLHNGTSGGHVNGSANQDGNDIPDDPDDSGDSCVILDD